MKLKLDAAGNVVLQDGHPVYIHDDGKEIPFDANAAMAKIATLNGEARDHRKAKESAEAALSKFAGIEDVDGALKALDLVKKLDQKKLIDAGQVDQVKAEITKAFETKLAEKDAALAKANDALHSEMIGGNFSRSKFIADKLAIPADVVQAFFGKNFKLEEGKVRAYNANGQPVYSRTNPGEFAGFDESLEILVDGYAQKDSILKSTQRPGSGAPANGGGAAGEKKIPRSQFATKSPAEQMEFVKGGGSVVDG